MIKELVKSRPEALHISRKALDATPALPTFGTR
jgi:hypothetical protein